MARYRRFLVMMIWLFSLQTCVAARDKMTIDAIVYDAAKAKDLNITPPSIIHSASPKYSKAAKRKRIEGKVLVSAIIDKNGIASDPKVVRSLDKELDERAIEAIKKWRFRPAIKDGVPVNLLLTLEVNYSLK